MQKVHRSKNRQSSSSSESPFGQCAAHQKFISDFLLVLVPYSGCSIWEGTASKAAFDFWLGTRFVAFGRYRKPFPADCLKNAAMMRLCLEL